jgi:hypothetical protein
MSQICIVSVKFLKDVRDFDRKSSKLAIRKLFIVELETKFSFKNEALAPNFIVFVNKKNNVIIHVLFYLDIIT